MKPGSLRGQIVQTLSGVNYGKHKLAQIEEFLEKARRGQLGLQSDLEISLMELGHLLMQSWGTLDFIRAKITRRTSKLLSKLGIWRVRDIPLTAKALREKFAALKEPPDPAQVEKLIEELTKISKDCWPYLTDNGKFR